MADESLLLSMPNEIIEKILDYPFLKIGDLARLQRVCSFFKDFIDVRQNLWKNKTLQKYDFLKPTYNALSHIDWYEQCKHIAETKNYMYEKIKEMSKMYRWRYISLSPDDMDPFIFKCMENSGRATQYVLYFLSEIIHAETPCDDTFDDSIHISLTTKYYAKKVYSHIVQKGILKDEWFKMIERNYPYVPDEVCKFALKWLYPAATASSYVIDDFNDKVNSMLMAELPPEHRLHMIDEDTRNKWKHEILTENQLDETNCRDIIRRVAHLLYKLDVCRILIVEGLCNLQMEEVVYNIECHKTIMHIMFETAARRCGVKIITKATNTHRFLYWRKNWTTKTPRYIVESMTGNLKPSVGSCPFAMNAPPEPRFQSDDYNPTELVLSVILQINETNTDFQNLIMEYSIECAFAVAPLIPLHVSAISNLYVMQKKNLNPIISHITSVLKDNRLRPLHKQMFEQELNRNLYANCARIQAEVNFTIPIKKRSPLVSFSIGLICRHKELQYLCVIRGWDYKCAANLDWQNSMRVNQLPFGKNQPFYNVTAEDGSERYVPQEFLEFVKRPQRLESVEDVICIDFSHFNGYVYVPNEEKLIQYPDDIDHIRFYVSKMIVPK